MSHLSFSNIATRRRAAAEKYGQSQQDWLCDANESNALSLSLSADLDQCTVARLRWNGDNASKTDPVVSWNAPLARLGEQGVHGHAVKAVGRATYRPVHSQTRNLPSFLSILGNHVLGASYAGLGATHYFLKHVYPRLPNDSNVTYHVLLVNPSSKWYSRVAAPRAAAGPSLLPIDDVFFDIEPRFRQYGNKVHFVQGKATKWDDKTRRVTVEKADGGIEDIAYCALILATGSRSDDAIFSLQGEEYTDVQDALPSLHKQLPMAKRIIISGGGPTSVETAGELADALNGTPGCFSSRPSHFQANIILITAASQLLPQLRQSISEQAQTYLARMGVDVRYNAKIVGAEPLPDGRASVNLQDGEKLVTDIYIPAVGVRPISDYVPSHLKDERGYVTTNESTLRVDAAGPRVYALGDVASYSNNSIIEILASLPVLEMKLQRDLLAAHSNADGKPDGADRMYVKNEKETQIVPIGRSKGVGAAFGWRLPSFLVWLFKGRDYMVSKAYSSIDGTAVLKESVWKQ